jgi:Restriction endonuclease S subunits
MSFNIEYKESWLTPELDEILMYIIGGDWGKEQTFNDDDFLEVLCIRGSEIRDWQKNKGNTAVIRKIANSSLQNRQLIEGDILLEISGGGPEQPVGRTVLIDKQALSFQPDIPKVCTNFMRLMRFPKSLDSKFINYFFDFFYASGEIVNYQGGSNNLRNLKFAEFSKIKIPLPPFNEQHRIVSKIEELFSDLDNGIANLKLAQMQLKAYRQALLKSAFEGKLTEQWRKENNPEPAEKLLERIKEERKKRYEQELKEWKEAAKAWEKNGKNAVKPFKPENPKHYDLSNSDTGKYTNIPETWSFTKIANISKVKTGITPLKSKTEYYRNGKIPWVTSGALNDWIVTKPSNFVTEKAIEETSLKIYPKNTLLVALYGEGKTRGKCSELAFESTTNQAIAAIIQKGIEEKLRSFLKFFLLMNYIELRELAVGGAQPNLSLGIIENTILPVASESELNIITDILNLQFSIIENLESTINNSIRKSEYLRQSILKKAFEGKLVEQDPNDEPATQLLKRIQAEKKQYLENQKKQKKTNPIKRKKMSKELSIEEVLQSSDKPMLAKDVWQQSKHKDSIEDFYAELKKIQDNIKEVKKGTESLLSLVK